jgi:hypothetical protein
MVLGKFLEIVRLDICYGTIIHMTIGNKACTNKLTQPFSCLWVILIVIGPACHYLYIQL